MQPGTTEHRKTARWRIFCPVTVRSIEYGETQALGINISTGGIFIQTFDPLPLGTRVEILLGDRNGIVARGVVRSHYYMTYREQDHPASCTGMGVRFTGFEDVAEGLDVPETDFLH